MVKRLPVLIREAKRKAESYRICQTARGFNVWCFREWASKRGGWSLVASNLSTRDAARANILERLGLEDPGGEAELVRAINFYVWSVWDWT